MGARLAELRRKRRLAQTDLADTAKLSTRGFQRIEAGHRRTRLSTLDRLAAALGDESLARELAVSQGRRLRRNPPTRSGSRAAESGDRVRRKDERDDLPTEALEPATRIASGLAAR
jgi:transcriptional regulator with XRE-family HTH domain